MVSSTSATVPGVGGGATTAGQGEETVDLRAGEVEEEVEVSVAVVVGVAAAAADDLNSRRRCCLFRDCDSAIADLENKDKEATLSVAENEAAAPRLSSAARRRAEGEDAAAVEATAATTRGAVMRRAALLLTSAAEIAHPRVDDGDEEAAGARIANERDGNETGDLSFATLVSSFFSSIVFFLLLIFFGLIASHSLSSQFRFNKAIRPPSLPLSLRHSPSPLTRRCCPFALQRAALLSEQRLWRVPPLLLLFSGDASSLSRHRRPAAAAT